MSSPDTFSLWNELRRTGISDRAGEFRIRLVASVHGVRIFAAVTGSSGDLAVVVDIPESLKPVRLSGVALRRLRVTVGSLEGLPPSRLGVVLELCDPEFEDLFGQLVADLVRVATSTADSESAVSAITGVLKKWRRFMECRTALLTDNEVKGLIGELVVLSRLARKLDASRALYSWKSPWGAIRDFETGNESVEVKTFAPSGGSVIRINDPLQLEPDPGRDLILACQPMSSSESSGWTLAQYVHNTGLQFARDKRLSEDFSVALAGAGYLECHAHLYQSKFVLGELVAFRVCAGFPRISPAQVAPEVRDVQFSIAVPALMSYVVPANDCIGIGEQRPNE